MNKKKNKIRSDLIQKIRMRDAVAYSPDNFLNFLCARVGLN